jgi:hypothetical protein
MVVLITKDINLRMKAKSLGIMAEDYRNDKVANIDDLYKGITVKEGVDQGIISKLYEMPEGVPCGDFCIEKKTDLFYGNCFLNSSSTYCAALVLDDWDKGYPVGGNYWRDYTGVDQYSGANQKINGSDGIGDTPYEAAEEIVDYYPLMKPPMEFKYQASPSWQLPQLPMPTPIPTPKPTPIPTAKPTPIPTPKPTPTPTQEPTPIPTPEPTYTPIPSSSPNPTQPSSSTITPTNTPKPTAKPTITPAPTLVTNKPVPTETEPPTSANPTSAEYPDSAENSWYLYAAIGALGMLSAVLIIILAFKTYYRNHKSGI